MQFIGSCASPTPPRSPRTRQRPRSLQPALPRTRRAGLRRSGGRAAGRSDKRIRCGPSEGRSEAEMAQPGAAGVGCARRTNNTRNAFQAVGPTKRRRQIASMRPEQSHESGKAYSRLSPRPISAASASAGGLAAKRMAWISARMGASMPRSAHRPWKLSVVRWPSTTLLLAAISSAAP